MSASNSNEVVSYMRGLTGKHHAAIAIAIGGEDYLNEIRSNTRKNFVDKIENYMEHSYNSWIEDKDSFLLLIRTIMCFRYQYLN